MQTEEIRREIRHRKQQPKPLRGGYHMAGFGGMGIGIGVGIGPSGQGVTPPPGSSGGPVDPLTIVTSRTALFGFSADIGAPVEAAGGVADDVSTWTDQSANAYTATQATEANRPTLITAALNTHNVLRFTKASTQRLVVGTLDLPAPGTTPIFICGAFKLNTFTTNDSIFGGNGSTTMRLLCTTTSMRCNNGANGNLVAVTAGVWYWFETYWANSATDDYLRIGLNTSASGATFGNNNPAAGVLTIGAQQTAGSNPADITLACMFAWSGGVPTELTTAVTGVRAWATGYYGGTLVI